MLITDYINEKYSVNRKNLKIKPLYVFNIQKVIFFYEKLFHSKLMYIICFIEILKRVLKQQIDTYNYADFFY